jgi:hypothetical protein
MVLRVRHTFAVLCEMLTITPIMTDVEVEKDPLHGLDAHQILILCIFSCGET